MYLQKFLQISAIITVPSSSGSRILYSECMDHLNVYRQGGGRQTLSYNLKNSRNVPPVVCYQISDNYDAIYIIK